MCPETPCFARRPRQEVPGRQRKASCPRSKASKWIGLSQPACQVSDTIAVRFERRKGRNRLGVRFRPKSFRIDQFSPPNAVSYWLLLKLTMPARACAADPKNCPLTSPLLARVAVVLGLVARSEEHTSELQSLMRISY